MSQTEFDMNEGSEGTDGMGEEQGGVVDITTKAPKAVKEGKKPEGWAIDIPFNFGTDLEEARALYGDKVVYNLYAGQARVAFQSQVRRLAEAGKSDEEIKSALSGWRPGTSISVEKDPLTAARENFMKLSPEEQAMLLADWQPK